MNLQFGMLLEVATAAGSLLGGITAQVVAGSILERMFGVVPILVAAVMRARVNAGTLSAIRTPIPGVLVASFR